MKVSVSIDDVEIEWVRTKAEREGSSVSAVVTEAIRLARQHEARLGVLGFLGAAGRLTPEREREIAAEQVVRTLPRRAKRQVHR